MNRRYGSKVFLNVFLFFTGVLFMAGLLAQCAPINVNLTHEAKYLEALSWYNDNLEIYLQHYRALPQTQQKEWKDKYHPIFIVGDKALEAWKLALPTTDAVTKEQAWMEAKRQILATLLSLNLVEVKQ